jgi:general secretion pathway protein J
VHRAEAGFTLVELLVSLVIFGMLSAAGVAILNFSIRAQALAGERQTEISGLRRFGAILTADLAQAAPRITRDEAGMSRPAFVGGTGETTLALVRRGWENFDGANRSSLQKVEYRLSGGRLERIGYRFVDGAAPMEPVTLLGGVRSLQLRYRDDEGAWRQVWDPTDVTKLPKAVEMVIDLERGGQIRQLFLVGTAT